jgi:hypothetical protein
VIRYIGGTSHSSRVLRDALEDYPYGCPLPERELEVRQLLPYVLSYPVSTAIVGIADLAHLEENVRIARSFEPLSEKKRAEIRALAATKGVSLRGI